jgi:hypothetical protein
MALRPTKYFLGVGSRGACIHQGACASLSLDPFTSSIEWSSEKWLFLYHAQGKSPGGYLHVLRGFPVQQHMAPFSIRQRPAIHELLNMPKRRCNHSPGIFSSHPRQAVETHSHTHTEVEAIQFTAQYDQKLCSPGPRQSNYC